MISLSRGGLLNSSRSRRCAEGMAKASLCMRKPGLIQIFIRAERDVFSVFTPPPPPTQKNFQPFLPLFEELRLIYLLPEDCIEATAESRKSPGRAGGELRQAWHRRFTLNIPPVAQRRATALRAHDPSSSAPVTRL